MNPNNSLPINAGVIFMAKLANEITGSATVTFSYNDRVSIRLSHLGRVYRVHVPHSRIIKDPVGAALSALKITEEKKEG